MAGLIQTLADGTTVARRNVIKIVRLPELLVAVLISPLIFVLPFRLDPGIVVETPVENVDIWPTLLDLLGLPARPGTDAHLRGHIHRRRSGRRHAEGHHRPLPVAANVPVGGRARPNRQ